MVQVQLDCDYDCANSLGTDLEGEGFDDRLSTSTAVWPNSNSNSNSNAEGNRDVTHVLMSPRVDASFHPMSRRSLSQKRMSEPSPYLLFKLFKGHRAPEPGDHLDPSLANSQTGGDGLKAHRRSNSLHEYAYVNSRFADSGGQYSSGVKKSWRQSLFYASFLLVVCFLVLKVMLLGWCSVHHHISDGMPVCRNASYLQLFILFLCYFCRIRMSVKFVKLVCFKEPSKLVGALCTRSGLVLRF